MMYGTPEEIEREQVHKLAEWIAQQAQRRLTRRAEALIFGEKGSDVTMDKQAIVNQIAQALLAVEKVPGVELCQSTLKIKDENGLYAVVTFAPETWRTYEPGKPLRMMLSLVDQKSNLVADEWVDVTL